MVPWGSRSPAGTASDLAGNLAPASGPSATFTVDNSTPTLAIGAPSSSYTASGPITYTVTYADAHFNTITLAAANITLNKTGNANGTVGVSGSGLTRTVTISSIHGRRFPGDLDRGRHRLGLVRRHGPSRRAQRDLHGGQHRPRPSR